MHKAKNWQNIGEWLFLKFVLTNFLTTNIMWEKREFLICTIWSTKWPVNDEWNIVSRIVKHRIVASYVMIHSEVLENTCLWLFGKKNGFCDLKYSNRDFVLKYLLPEGSSWLKFNTGMFVNSSAIHSWQVKNLKIEFSPCFYKNKSSKRNFPSNSCLKF